MLRGSCAGTQAGADPPERQHEIPVTQFASARSEDILVDVPTAQLAAGEYLVTLEATSGRETVRRNRRLRILDRAPDGTTRKP